MLAVVLLLLLLLLPIGGCDAQNSQARHLHRLQCDAFCDAEQKAVHSSVFVSPAIDELHGAPAAE